MKNFEYYSEYIAEIIQDCKKSDDTCCDCCKQKEMCDQFYSVEQIKKWFFEEWKPKLTNDEIAILKNLPKEYKWIARDNDNSLFIYDYKPEKRNEIWRCGPNGENFKRFDLYNNLYKFIKWEDKEPYSIEELLKEN